MTTLADRMQFIIDQNWVANPRAWSVAAGLAGQQVTTYLERAKNKPDADITSATAVALAKAAKVSVEWFLTGEGVARGERNPRVVENYICSRLRELRRDDSALGKVAAELGVDLAMTRRVWGGGTIGDVGKTKWPRALGLTSYESLDAAAREWWRLRGERLHALVSPATDTDEARSRGNADARALNATDADILAVLEANEGVGQQTHEWWYERFISQASRREIADRAWERNVKPAEAKKARVVREKQRVTRDAHKRRSGTVDSAPESKPRSKRATGTK